MYMHIGCHTSALYVRLCEGVGKRTLGGGGLHFFKNIYLTIGRDRERGEGERIRFCGAIKSLPLAHKNF